MMADKKEWRLKNLSSQLHFKSSLGAALKADVTHQQSLEYELHIVTEWNPSHLNTNQTETAAFLDSAHQSESHFRMVTSLLSLSPQSPADVTFGESGQRSFSRFSVVYLYFRHWNLKMPSMQIKAKSHYLWFSLFSSIFSSVFYENKKNLLCIIKLDVSWAVFVVHIVKMSVFIFPLQVLHETFPKHTFLMNGLIQGVKVSWQKLITSKIWSEWWQDYRNNCQLKQSRGFAIWLSQYE